MVDDLFDIAAPPGGESGTGGNGDAGGEEGLASVVLRVHAQPGAGRTAVVGRHGTALKVRVAAPPEGGRANEGCRALLAETFGVATAAVSLTGGATSRLKRFRLDGVDLEEFRKRLEQAVAEGGAAGRGPRRTGR